MAFSSPSTPLRFKPVENLLWDASQAIQEAQGKVKEALSHELGGRLQKRKNQHHFQTEMNKNSQLVREITQLRQQNQSLYQQNLQQAKHLHRLQSEANVNAEELTETKSSQCLLTQDIMKICSEKDAISQELERVREQQDIEVLERQIAELALDQFKDEVIQLKDDFEQQKAFLLDRDKELEGMRQALGQFKEQVSVYEGLLTGNETTVEELHRQLSMQSLINAGLHKALDECQCSGKAQGPENVESTSLKRSRSSTPTVDTQGGKRQKTSI